MPTKRPTPNDQRSNVKNPNNPDNKAARDNRANQRNPNHTATKVAEQSPTADGRIDGSVPDGAGRKRDGGTR